MKNKQLIKQFLIQTIIAMFFVISSNLFLQFCQFQLSAEATIQFFYDRTQLFILGSLVLFQILMLIIFLMGSFVHGVLIYSIIVFFVGAINFLKMEFRQEPLYPSDLDMIKDVSSLQEFISIKVRLIFLAAGIILLLLLFLAFKKSSMLKKHQQVFRASLLLILMVSLYYTSDFNKPSNFLRQQFNKTALWIPSSQKENYLNVGFVGGFLYNLTIDAMEKPDTYTKANIEKIIKKYETKIVPDNQEQPNIVFIMNESFSDPTRLDGIGIQGEPISSYKEIAKSTYSGKMLSPNYGAGTANVEFEALTSFSMEMFLPQMTTPYTMLLPKLEKIPSVVDFMKRQGYTATAIHPFDSGMYRRNEVYPLMGFDEFRDQKTMKHQEKIEKDHFISDESSYNEVLDVLKNNESQFIHLVTVQGHIPYENRYTEIDYNVTGNGANNGLENYVQDTHYTSEAVKQFIAQLKQLNERTLVVFWGDHLPGIYSEAVEAENPLEKMYETEFFIWDSKNQISKQQEVTTSPCYFMPTLVSQAGLKGTGYYRLLEQLQSVLPAFEKGMYYQEGHWSDSLELSAEQKEIYEEYRMIQYDILAGKQYSLETNFFIK